MKHNYTLLGLLAAVALVFAVGCSKSDRDEVLLSQTQTETANEGEKNYLYATIEDEESRTFVVDNRIICWHAGDMISAFCNTTYNSKYTFLGEDGDKGGMFTVTQSGSGNVLDYFYAIYPYNTEVTMKVDGKITTTLPYLQSYAKDSFGKGANPMVAVATNSAQKLMFNNVCGYLKIKLYGNNVKLRSVVLQGNNGEKLSGAATISAPYGEKPTVTMAADATEAVAISCVNGVTLGTTSEDATTFWFALPSTTFEKGITITAYTTDGLGFTQSTSNKVTITRNRIQPMGAVEVKDLVKASVPSNEIWYTSSNGKIVTPYNTNVFGATILSNTYEGNLGIITFDRPITSIGSHAFRGCTSLTSITIPDSVTSIGNEAFFGCSSLTSVTIPDSVTSIGYGAFWYCRSLTSVTIPDSVTSIGDWPFRDCTSLNAFYGKFASSDNRCLIVNGYLCSFALGCGATEYTIPNSVTSIGSCAFEGCTSLTKVTIPDSVTEIGGSAFCSCTSLTSVTIPDSVTSIGSYAFYDCDALTNVTIPDSVTSIGSYAFYDCDALTNVTIGNSVTEIGNCAFEYCTSLTNVTIGNSVTEIGNCAFEYCTSLTSVTIGNSVTSIGYGAFYNCSSLTSVTIPDSVTSIGESAFSDCASLTSVTIGNSVTSIGSCAFFGCTSLKEVYCKPTTPPAGDEDMFKYRYDDGYKYNIGCKIYVPAGTESKYKSASYWRSYSSYIYGVIFTDENEPID